MKSRSNVVVRYAETDKMGIAHHASYPVWYEVSRTDLIKKMGITYTGMEAMGLMLPLVELHCKYNGVARYEDELIVESWISALVHARMEINYAVFRAGEERPISLGRTVHAVVDKSMRPVSLKKYAPKLYAKMLAAVEGPE